MSDTMIIDNTAAIGRQAFVLDIGDGWLTIYEHEIPPPVVLNWRRLDWRIVYFLHLGNRFMVTVRNFPQRYNPAQERDLANKMLREVMRPTGETMQEIDARENPR